MGEDRCCKVFFSCVRTADIDGKSLVIEVGPGGGIMTRELSLVSNNVLAYEIDNDLNASLVGQCEKFGYITDDTYFKFFSDGMLLL